MPAIENIRTWLMRRVRPPFAVTAKRTQYWCSDDYAFFTEIDVQHPVDEFVLSVNRAGDERHDDFIFRALHHAFPEVWLVDPEAHYVVQSRRDSGSVRLLRDGVLVSAQLPSIRIPLAEVLGQRVSRSDTCSGGIRCPSRGRRATGRRAGSKLPGVRKIGTRSGHYASAP